MQNLTFKMKHLSEFVNESLNQRLGQCYELSYKYVSSNPGWELVHGYITDSNFGTGHTIDHAWCQKGNKTFDPVLEKEYSKQDHKKIFNPEIVKVYTFEQVMDNAVKYMHYGPWHKIDNSKIKFNKDFDKKRRK